MVLLSLCWCSFPFLFLSTQWPALAIHV
jgi:hypothetical protein